MQVNMHVPFMLMKRVEMSLLYMTCSKQKISVFFSIKIRQKV